MTKHGRYGSIERTFALPANWDPVADQVLKTAQDAALSALSKDVAVESLSAYYDRDGGFAGTLFLDAQPNVPDSIEASDLYAVTTLSMDLDSRQGRLLLDPGDQRHTVLRSLRGLDPNVPITDLEHAEVGSAELLQRMHEMYGSLRTLLGDRGNRWVFASKVCARKRPRLFPVRDNLVCQYLGGGRPLKSGDGWPGDFPVDIQVFAFLMTLPAVTSALTWIRAELEDAGGVRLDGENLRLLDSALWMAAKRASTA